ncbi:NAD(P)H-hydrate dehydratase [Microaerobacter geothermalis]|uniref:NAD(P)H-hydrate dehydratase n=1 Tax=Microaerobacter geothermalis TaxID=674972 RepID=UPI001F18359B|nr:NAD(P)H-hydrate dehydratase [Microaerobacter geothermalis]MCF6093762.1 NAD(P)H-hydrate dehydratase [Microaerobacter geothermalis]
MLLVTAQQMREMDRFTIEKVGIPAEILMENAGVAVANEVEKNLNHRGTILVLSGHGNNGGDGFVAARHLSNHGHPVFTWLVGSADKMSPETKLHYEALKRAGYPVYRMESDWALFQEHLARAEVVVDALLGIGIKGELREPVRGVISYVNRNRKGTVISADIPSGLDSDTGSVKGEAVYADKTVTFAYPKWGHFLGRGIMHTGQLIVADISIPPMVSKQWSASAGVLLEDELISSYIPPRKRDSHKGTYGHVCIISGSRQMVGAPVLAAQGALRTGVGMVTLAVPRIMLDVIGTKIMEPVLWDWESTGDHFSPQSSQVLRERLSRYRCVALGPGIGVWDGAEEWLERILSTCEIPLILDADGINILARNPSILRKKQGPVILTPHPGEMSRLLGCTVTDVEENRREVSLDFSEKFGVYVLLKGHRTLITTPDKRIFLNHTGNSSMAKGGSGDVLTGMIAGLIAQSADVEKGLLCAAYIHGIAGELSSRESLYSPVASDLIQQIGRAMQKLSLKGRQG